MHVIRHQVALLDPTFLLPGEAVKHFAQVFSKGAVQHLPALERFRLSRRSIVRSLVLAWRLTPERCADGPCSFHCRKCQTAAASPAKPEVSHI